MTSYEETKAKDDALLAAADKLYRREVTELTLGIAVAVGWCAYLGVRLNWGAAVGTFFAMWAVIGAGIRAGEHHGRRLESLKRHSLYYLAAVGKTFGGKQ